MDRMAHSDMNFGSNKSIAFKPQLNNFLALPGDSENQMNSNPESIVIASPTKI